MSSTPISIAVHIKGRVQGVGFRAWTRREAQALGLTGWVRNERDGTVRAVFTGTEQATAAITERLRDGPPGSNVTEVLVEDTDPAETDRGFTIA